MKKQLFCIPLRSGCLERFKQFINEAKHSPKWQGEWENMVERYASNSLEIYHRALHGTDYIFMVFESGERFAEVGENWNSPSENEFENWFKSEVAELYADNPLNMMADRLMVIDRFDATREAA